jgi:hypothetical protein
MACWFTALATRGNKPAPCIKTEQKLMRRQLKHFAAIFRQLIRKAFNVDALFNFVDLAQ